MASVSEHTPLYVDCMALCEWLFNKFDQAPGVLSPSLCRCSLALLQAVVLALKDRDRGTQIDLADEQLIRLRVLLRLAVDTGRLSDQQYAFALDRCCWRCLASAYTIAAPWP